jgi:hypothetical protein
VNTGSRTGPGIVKISYKASDGSVVTGPWGDITADAIASGLPWRTFPWYLGQKNYSGLYWCATQRALVGYESRLELSRLMLADFDTTVTAIVSQPCQMRWVVGASRVRRISDYLVCTRSGPVIIDVKGARSLQNPDIAGILDTTRRMVEACGWRYEIVSEPAKVEFANVRFLAGYRRPELVDPELLSAIKELVLDTGDVSVGEVVASTAYPKHAALPALMHLLWRQMFVFDLSRRLCLDTVIRAAS